MIANAVIVRDQVIPIHGRPICQSRFGQAGHDGGFAPQMFAGWFKMAARRIDDAHGIFHRDELLTGFLSIDFRAAETRQDERDFSYDEV